MLMVGVDDNSWHLDSGPKSAWLSLRVDRCLALFSMNWVNCRTLFRIIIIATVIIIIVNIHHHHRLILALSTRCSLLPSIG